MFFVTLKRILKAGGKNFLRNGLLSISSILVMVIAMLISLAVYFSTVVISASIEMLENKVDINIYFKPEAPADKILEFKKNILSLPEVDVEKTNFISKEEALERFKKKHGETSIMDALEVIEDNPLGAVLNIKAKEIGEYSEISKFIESRSVVNKYGDIIDNLNYNQNKKAIEKLNILISYTYKIGGIVSLVLVILSIIVIYNTVRIIIYNFKEEISIMRLVGASKFFARGPFVVEGMLYGIVSAILSFLIV